jgi:hypothetical protein
MSNTGAEPATMFSDHFRSELLAQMARAASRGARHILINSNELHCSLGDFPGADHQSTACCEVMEGEMKAYDVLVVEKSNGYGLTIRYMLPRSS